MGEVIPVDFMAEKRARAEAQPQSPPPVQLTQAQASMLHVCMQSMTEEEFVEMQAAIHDFDCYMQATNHVRMLSDIYHMLQAWH